MGSGASRNLDTQQIEQLKKEVAGLKTEMKAKDVEMDRLSVMSLTDNPIFDFSGRTYKKIKVIGKGASAICFLVERESDQKTFVVKQLMIPVEELAKKHGFADEVKVMSRFKHPNIVRLYDSYIEGEVLFILMENAAGGSLYDRIVEAGKQEPKAYFKEEEILRWFVQIMLALKHVHDHKILHRDVTAKNVFMSGEGDVKLGDFGISKQLSTQTNLASTVIGTPNYLSPEIWQGRPYDAKSDVWALGCILCQMAALKQPFTQPDLPSMMNAITNAQHTPVPDHYSNMVKTLVASIIRPKPQDRPTLGQLMRVRVLQKYILQHLDQFGETVETLSALEGSGMLPPPNGGPAPPKPTAPPARSGVKKLRKSSTTEVEGDGGGPKAPPMPAEGAAYIRKSSSSQKK
jgi:serine/threonine protein kinase